MYCHSDDRRKEESAFLQDLWHDSNKADPSATPQDDILYTISTIAQFTAESIIASLQPADDHIYTAGKTSPRHAHVFDLLITGIAQI